MFEGPSSPLERPGWARRLLYVTALTVLPLLSCKTSRASEPELVEPGQVPAELRDEWEALLDAREKDRAGARVEEAADALLGQDPPTLLRVGALQAKAERQYLLGADAEALRLCDEALALLAATGDSKAKASEEMLAEVHRTLALTLVRSGDPQRAVEELDLLEGWGSVERETLRGARAVALDRQGDQSAALAAFVAWRELLTDDSPDAGYAEDRIRALVTGLDRATIEELAKNAPGPDAADCLRATIGIAPGDQSPTWVSKCRPLPARIGILLPRSGKLAALADAQFAAAVAAVTVLGSERPVSVMWRDSGSTAASTKAAATQLLADGAEVIVGPVGADNVRAAVSVAGHERFLLPGESVSSARGIAPSLEQRARTLVAHAADHAPAAATSVLVMIPENGYGRRAQKALESDQGSFSKSLKFMTYTSSTKSFSPILRPVADALQKGAPVVVVDALPRTELIARQLRRDGLRIAGGSVDQEGAEVAVYAMGEGLSPERVGAKHESLDGVVLAPVAAPDAESRDFEDRYLAQQGLPPDDQALLVWSALEAAWSGASSTHEPQVQLVRVEGGRVVALGTP